MITKALKASASRYYDGLESVHEMAMFIEEHGTLEVAVLDHWCDELEDTRTALEEHTQVSIEASPITPKS